MEKYKLNIPGVYIYILEDSRTSACMFVCFNYRVSVDLAGLSAL